MSFACYAKPPSGEGEEAEGERLEEEFCGPFKYAKFKCPSISDLEVLPENHPLEGHLHGRFSRQHELVAFTALDGVFRVIDLVNLEPVYEFKSNYGGITAFAIENNGERCVRENGCSGGVSPFVSLAC